MNKMTIGTMNTNVSRSESLRRYALGFGILAFFFANPAMPAWITLIALYPLATALVQWDPANALFEKILNKGASQIGGATLGNAHKV